MHTIGPSDPCQAVLAADGRPVCISVCVKSGQPDGFASGGVSLVLIQQAFMSVSTVWQARCRAGCTWR